MMGAWARAEGCPAPFPPAASPPCCTSPSTAPRLWEEEADSGTLLADMTQGCCPAPLLEKVREACRLSKV